MDIEARDKKLRSIIDWSRQNVDVSVLLLTSSLVNPNAPVDEFSDLDIEIVLDDNMSYVAENSWLEIFGRPIAMIEEDESCFDGKYAMKMVMYDDYVKVDFKLYKKDSFIEEVNQKELCEDWDIGYKVLIDKEVLTLGMKKPGYQASIIKRPPEKDFITLLNDFWWDTIYVAKCLVREDIFYAKFMSENNIRTAYLVPLIEWYIASQHNWNITTNKHGRMFRMYLAPEIYDRLLKTFSGPDIEENWEALFVMADLVTEVGSYLAEQLGYVYPVRLDKDIRNYLNAARYTSRKEEH